MLGPILGAIGACGSWHVTHASVPLFCNSARANCPTWPTTASPFVLLNQVFRRYLQGSPEETPHGCATRLEYHPAGDIVADCPTDFETDAGIDDVAWVRAACGSTGRFLFDTTDPAHDALAPPARRCACAVADRAAARRVRNDKTGTRERPGQMAFDQGLQNLAKRPPRPRLNQRS